jgi:hypothetical protein
MPANKLKWFARWFLWPVRIVTIAIPVAGMLVAIAIGLISGLLDGEEPAVAIAWLRPRKFFQDIWDYVWLRDWL